MNSLYDQIKKNPPQINIPEGSRDVILELVSVMCDNKYRFHFKRNSEGDFKLSTGISAYSNFQIPNADRTDLEWLADEENWSKVIDSINEGTTKVCGIKTR